MESEGGLGARAANFLSAFFPSSPAGPPQALLSRGAQRLPVKNPLRKAGCSPRGGRRRSVRPARCSHADPDSAPRGCCIFILVER